MSKSYIRGKIEKFVRDGTKFLEGEIGHTEWTEQHERELRQKSEEVKQCEQELKQKLEEYYEESERRTEETDEKLRQKIEEVDELKKALTWKIEEYYEKYEKWAEETEEKLTRKIEDEELKRHEGLLQKVKDIISMRTGENKQEITQRIKETIQNYEKEIKVWRENHNKVVELGGLHIVGTEHHEARRIDNQLRGRAGRQGDPGSSRFYASLEDEIVRRFGGDRVKGVMQWAGMDENTPIEHPFVTKAMTNSQVQTEGYHFNIRKHLVEYDDVINKHREVIYAERKKILSGADLKANITSMVRDEIQSLVAKRLSSPHLTSPLMGEEKGEGEEKQSNLSGLLEDVSTIFPLPPQFRSDGFSELSAQQITEKLTDYAIALYNQREQELGPENMRLAEKLVMLRVIDRLWMEHLTAMEHLRQGIGLRAVGQEQPLIVYKREGHAYFEALLASIQHDVVHSIYHVGIAKEAPQKKKEAVMAGKRVGRNDPCPCGSGKKYKHCCGK